jgi:hypothetical protein
MTAAMTSDPTAMHGIELTNHLRLLSGYHLGTDLIDRLTAAERFQKQQREALAQAADEIERLTGELEDARRLQGNGCSPVA